MVHLILFYLFSGIFSFSSTGSDLLQTNHITYQKINLYLVNLYHFQYIITQNIFSFKSRQWYCTLLIIPNSFLKTFFQSNVGEITLFLMRLGIALHNRQQTRIQTKLRKTVQGLQQGSMLVKKFCLFYLFSILACLFIPINIANVIGTHIYQLISRFIISKIV